MGDDTLAAVLEREHREIDAGVEAYLAGGDAGALGRALGALRRHIFLEEEFLFPPLREAGLVAPIFVMLREHGEIWDTLDAVEAGLAGGDPAAACRALLEQLDRHNAKEEPIVYPQADAALSASASAGLRAFLECGRMPEGWICARAGASGPPTSSAEVAATRRRSPRSPVALAWCAPAAGPARRCPACSPARRSPS